MTWQTGTATDYKDLLDQLVEVATNSHVDSVAINAAGTGYSVGDIEVLDGGTVVGGHTAAVEILAESGGVPSSIRISRGGSYTVNPGTADTTSNEGTVADPGTPGTGSGLTIDTTIATTDWSVMRNLVDLGLTDVTLVSGGSATYAVNDILTLVGGTGTAATVRVLTETAGVIDTIAVETPGSYTVSPGGGTLATTGGGGSGATVSGAFNGTVGRNQVILQGLGSGDDEIYVGAYTYNDVGADAHNWELAGFTGYSAALAWADQPGISFGRQDDQASIFGGSYLLCGNASMDWWMSVTSRTIKVMPNIGTTYGSSYLGWLDPLHTEAELPNPLYIAGQTDDETMRYSSSSLANSSIADPIANGPDATLGNKGPGQFRDSAGVWNRVRNSTTSGSRIASHIATIYPAGQAVGTDPAASPVLADDQVVKASDVSARPGVWPNIIPNAGTPGAQLTRLMPTPNSAGDIPILWPCTLLISEADSSVLSAIGELSGVFWLSAEGGMVTEDTMLDADDPQIRYRIFQSGTRADLWAHFAVRED